MEKVLRGTAAANISFEDMRKLLISLAFAERIKGSHHIFTRADTLEILNLQPKGDQVKQVRHPILKYKLGGALGD